MLSRPVGVHWAGWEADTLQLHKAGWQMAVEYDVQYDKYRLLMHHREGKLWGMSDATTIEKMWASPMHRMDRVPCFFMTGLAARLEVIRWQEMSSISFADYQQIDPRPQLEERRIERPEDFNVFKLVDNHEADILVDEADMTVIDHLKAIKDLQSDEQQRIRDRLLRAKEIGETPDDHEVKVHANVISFRHRT